MIALIIPLKLVVALRYHSFQLLFEGTTVRAVEIRTREMSRLKIKWKRKIIIINSNNYYSSYQSNYLRSNSRQWSLPQQLLSQLDLSQLNEMTSNLLKLFHKSSLIKTQLHKGTLLAAITVMPSLQSSTQLLDWRLLSFKNSTRV